MLNHSLLNLAEHMLPAGGNVRNASAAAPDGLPGPSPCRRGANGQFRTLRPYREAAAIHSLADARLGLLRVMQYSLFTEGPRLKLVP
jgi:hypothetical protein